MEESSIVSLDTQNGGWWTL